MLASGTVRNTAFVGGSAMDSTQVRVLLPPPSHPDRKNSPLLSFQRPHHAALNPTLFAGGSCDWFIRSCRPWKVAVAAVWWGLVGCFLLGPSNLTDWGNFCLPDVQSLPLSCSLSSSSLHSARTRIFHPILDQIPICNNERERSPDEAIPGPEAGHVGRHS